jgi:hypothetical protein
MSFKQTNIFEFLVDAFSKNIDNIKDTRRQRDDIKYSFKDIILSAFSIFYFQSKSWLSFQRKMDTNKGSSNAQTMFGITDIPSDNHIRNILDKITPDSFKSVYDSIHKYLDKIGLLKKFNFMDKYLLVALDGTYYHSSKNISCKCCQTRKDKETSEVHYYHTAITPTIVHPDSKKVLPLMQEFMSNSDGEDKQDCEVNASKRWLDSFIVPSKDKVIILGDDLYSREPMIKKVLDKKHSYIFVAKPTSHKYLYEQIDMIKNLGNCDTKKVSKMVNGKKQIFTYNYINDLSIKSSQGNTNNPSQEVNWCEVVVTNASGKKLYSNSFVTDISLNTNNIEDITLAGRTRWKIENENNNTLKTKGYNLEHNFGHGKENLSQTLCTLNILAFLFHTVQDLEDETYIELRNNIGTREEFFTGINFLTSMFRFKSFDKMIEFILISRQTEENIDMEPFMD